MGDLVCDTGLNSYGAPHSAGRGLTYYTQYTKIKCINIKLQLALKQRFKLSGST